jgi:hypothetical protein
VRLYKEKNIDNTNMIIPRDQNHLNYYDRINFGAYYTPKKYIDIVWNFIEPYVSNDSVVLDTSCGYGNFFEHEKKCIKKANDIDKTACDIIKKRFNDIEVFNVNALKNVSRKQFNIEKENLIIIGNPPYNDTTSIIRNGIKSYKFSIDTDILTRDLGISFLLSYAKLEADIICILHPLSYLIKEANFKLLKHFNKNYKLKDGVIVDSSSFRETSKGISFPILIGLYVKDKEGMDYDYIKDYKFKTIKGKIFSLNRFDFIRNYVRKYPLKNIKPKPDDILFWTMRDINALKRNKTFVKHFGPNTIIVDKNKLDYYIYIDVFKQYSKHIPYYFGNLEVFINKDLFDQYKKLFYKDVLQRYPFLEKYLNFHRDNSVFYKNEIIKYFKDLLGEHYVY